MARDGAPNFRTSHYWCDESDRQTVQWVALVLAEQDRQLNANFGSLGVSDSSELSAHDGAHHILGVASVSMNKEKILIYFFFFWRIERLLKKKNLDGQDLDRSLRRSPMESVGTNASGAWNRNTSLSHDLWNG